jgi:hypothetical protein
VTFSDIKRLLINVLPGFMKSLLTDVFWPAWEWGPMNMPHMRYVAFSYSEGITARDNNKMVRLVTSQAYRRPAGRPLHHGEARRNQDREQSDRASSWRPRSAAEAPENAATASSSTTPTTSSFFRESMSNRLNDDTSAIVVIMQRLHEGDVSGDILAREADYCHHQPHPTRPMPVLLVDDNEAIGRFREHAREGPHLELVVVWNASTVGEFDGFDPYFQER